MTITEEKCWVCHEDVYGLVRGYACTQCFEMLACKSPIRLRDSFFQALDNDHGLSASQVKNPSEDSWWLFLNEEEYRQPGHDEPFGTPELRKHFDEHVAIVGVYLDGWVACREDYESRGRDLLNALKALRSQVVRLKAEIEEGL